MKQRIITAILLGAFLVPVLFFSTDLIFKVVFAAFSVVASLEVLKCAQTHKRYVLSIPLLLFSFIAPILSSSDFVIPLSLLIMFYCFAVLVLSNGKTLLSDISVSLASVLYIVAGFSLLVQIREIDRIFFWLTFVAAWGCDIFAYFTGKFFGKRKLIPDISPNKTVAGAVGGALAGIILFIVFGFIFKIEINVFVLAGLGCAASIIAQFGDLIMSAIKRNYGIKDFGRIFPGHGGVLDRFDSIIAVSPLLYAFMAYCL